MYESSGAGPDPRLVHIKKRAELGIFGPDSFEGVSGGKVRIQKALSDGFGQVRSILYSRRGITRRSAILARVLNAGAS